MNHDSAAGGYSTAAGYAEGAKYSKQANSTAISSSLPSFGLLVIVRPHTTSTANNADLSQVKGSPSEITQKNVNGTVLTAAASSPQQVLAVAHSKNLSLMFILSALVMLIAGALAAIDKKLRR